MADRALSTSRRALLGAAAAIPFLPLQPAGTGPIGGPPLPPSPALAEWNERLTRYRHLAARAKAAAETGWFRAANDRYYRESADPAADHQAAFARLDRAEELYWRRCVEPLERAAVALVTAPPPNLEALANKLALIRSHRLLEAECLDRDCFEMLEEDVRQLATGSGAANA